MLDIDLLPPEYGPGKIVTPSNLIVIALSFLICLSLLLSSLRLLTAVQDHSLKMEYHEAQIELYKRQVEDIHKLAERVQLLRGRLNLVEELLLEKAAWSDKFIELSQSLPQYGAWMNTLTVERPAATRQTAAPGAATAAAPGAATATAPKMEPLVADITGDVASIDKVRQFVGKLEDSDTFGNIIFNSVVYEPTKVGTQSPVSFEFSVEIVGLKEDF